MDSPSVLDQKDEADIVYTGLSKPKAPNGSLAILNTANSMADREDVREPSVPSPQDSSSVSSVNPDMLGDEIIVGTHDNDNGDETKNSPLQVVSENEDADLEDPDDGEPVAHYPKRKRSTVYNDLAEDKMDTPMTDDPVTEAGTPNAHLGQQGPTVVEVRQGLDKREAKEALRDAKAVSLGYWRESTVPDVAGKHNIIGFMDVRDRLRTRIQYFTRDGDVVNSKSHPIPSGPGGSWVTFSGIVFHDHLIGMDHREIKEFVQLRSETVSDKETVQERDEKDLAAVAEAKRHVAARPTPENNNTALQIAYGLEIPDNALNGRHDTKRRRTSATGTISDRASANAPGQTPGPSQMLPPAHPERSAGPAPAHHPHQLDPLPGTRPTRIPVGTWSKSDSQDIRERHAVYGILGANDMFRVKLVRETLDGRYVDGNFPAGAGALWIPYEEVDFLRHIQHLNRPEIKEYVRVRQWQVDQGEKEEEKVANETKAVYEAQTRAASTMVKGQSSVGNIAPRASLAAEREDLHEQMGAAPSPTAHEPRHPRSRDMLPRNEPPMSRHPLPEQPEMRNMNHPHGMDPVERIQGLASREIARAEAVQVRQDARQHGQNRFVTANAPVPEPLPSAAHHRHQFQENRERMQKIWVSQEQSRMPPNNEDMKIYQGIKYERKQNGPWAGKLVSQGAILTIDGEDYVEYRVLTKPTFF
ncbi:hypothetical protein F5Y16DRAFT_366620 [Xylariaceae sp. FL0255]|nr:hypothetical protein F5Y16DRAFT_366620 [Xylariaceae sp. FL0255]